MVGTCGDMRSYMAGICVLMIRNYALVRGVVMRFYGLSSFGRCE